MRKILAGVDLGSEYLKLIVAEEYNGRMLVLAEAITPSKGIENGIINKPLELIPELEKLIKKGEEMLGLPIKKVITTIPTDKIKFHMNEGYTTLKTSEEQIKNSDIIRAMQSAVYNQIENEEELGSIMPISYKVDDKPVISPLGIEGQKLAMKSIFTTIPKKNLTTVIKCFAKIGIEVIDTTYSCIGDYYEFKNNTIKEKVGAIINIGFAKTDVSIFNKGVLTNTISLETGVQNIINDLSYIYKVPITVAKDIKNNLCLGHKRGTSPNNRKDYTTKTGEKITISEYEATEIASSRIEEILKIAKKQINVLTKKEIHYIIITGGISEMANFNITVEEIFGHLAKLGDTKELGLRNNTYSTTMGLIKYYIDKLELRNQEFTLYSEEELEDLMNFKSKININENSILGKLFGYFFDN